MKYTLLSLMLMFTFLACSQNKSSDSDNLESQIESLLSADEYVQALEILEEQPESAEVLKLKEKTHLNYGLFLEYRNSDVTDMRDKMNSAMRQYIKVLNLNPENEKAVTEIQQILGIYSTFGNRQPADDVMEDLRELGFDV